MSLSHFVNARYVLQKGKTVRPDSKGRITLGKRAREFSGYTMKEKQMAASCSIEPLIEVPAKEVWLYENKEAFASVTQGLEESAAGKTKSLGSFAKYAEDDDEK